ncbi:poly-beta-1,6-N-acetyl-D-glucosamine N-deacetylase precursor [bacterium BMS3Abin05]|nr:poly-beta-1,6-N-acetyl-D-glucosamine N-deacetylase precursor [bacterium BMS3Abin05]GBE27669.1 poly-beta-1,6-N-acetyl-D-glucosamine N-deacetylase precursor [bacterium BMS3Bbin03]HDK35402.1 hypothetical protein [Bacteroidota bacterium]HDZ12011.1 hypothetical protein [Bacteroidota bacterium]
MFRPLKQTAAAFLFRTSRVLFKGRPSGERAVILNYHQLCEKEDLFLPALSVSVFRKQAGWLAENFKVISLEELASRQRKGLSLKNLAAITFDDGYADNYEFAFPILKALKLPATFFITTRFIDGEIPWFDRIKLTFRETKANKTRLRLNGRYYDIQLKTHEDRIRAISFVKNKLKIIPVSDLADYLTEIEERLNVIVKPLYSRRMMRWEQIREMSDAGMTIGSHTCSHPILSILSENELRTEIVQSKARLEEELNRPIRTFCYPNGKAEDFGERAKRVLKEAGYDCAVTTEIGFVRKQTNLYELPRMYTTIHHLPSFAMKIRFGRNK